VRRLRKGIPGAAVSLAVAKGSERLDLANSAGFLGGWRRRGLSASLRADVAEPGNLLELSTGREGVDFAGLSLDAAAEDLIERAALARKVAPFETAAMPVLFSPQALGDVLCALEAGLSGMAAALGLSPIRDKVGERILSEKVTLVEEPRLPGSYRSCPIDDEGTPTARRALVERGVLRGFFHTLESAAMRGERPPATRCA
jgi:PmbA protein